jgi:hypothetical protein
MSYHKFFITVIILTSVTISAYITNVFGWHGDLGITDEQAAQLYRTNPNDPLIVAWKNSIQYELNLMKQANCIGSEGSVFGTHEGDAACKDVAKVVYDNCISHPGELLACLDTRLAKLAGASTVNVNSSNSSSAD